MLGPGSPRCWFGVLVREAFSATEAPAFHFYMLLNFVVHGMGLSGSCTLGECSTTQPYLLPLGFSFSSPLAVLSQQRRLDDTVRLKGWGGRSEVVLLEACARCLRIHTST